MYGLYIDIRVGLFIASTEQDNFVWMYRNIAETSCQVLLWFPHSYPTKRFITCVTIVSRMKKVDLIFFILFSHFYFIFYLFSFILFLELGLE